MSVDCPPPGRKLWLVTALTERHFSSCSVIRLESLVTIRVLVISLAHLDRHNAAVAIDSGWFLNYLAGYRRRLWALSRSVGPFRAWRAQLEHCQLAKLNKNLDSQSSTREGKQAEARPELLKCCFLVPVMSAKCRMLVASSGFTGRNLLLQNTCLMTDLTILVYRAIFSPGCWLIGGEANDVLRLVREPFCLRYSPLSSDPRFQVLDFKHPNQRTLNIA